MVENTDSNVLDGISLKDFTLDRILFNNAQNKIIGLLGVFTNSADQGIVIIEKNGFTEENFITENVDDLIVKHILLQTTEINDVYGNFSGDTEAKFGKLKVSIIYPATEKHISKYSEQQLFMIEETPEMYANVTLPYIEKEQFTLDWVYNVLEHKKEADKILFEDLDPAKGFILLPDYKWNGQIESMYIQAIVMDRNIKSIRELNASHLPLLENIKVKGFETIQAKYGLKENQIRAYFHYQPSYYHLHVHFTVLKYVAPGTYCGKAHLLSTVIDNIKIMPDYYQKATMTFYIGELSGLFNAIKESQSADQ